MKEKKIAKTFLPICIAVPAFAFGAAFVPSVTDVTMTQAQDRTVTITYKLANAPAVVTLDIQTNTTDGAWVSIGGENISGVKSGVPKGDVWKVVEGDADDVHTITWRPDRSAWVDSRVPANGARAVVTAWATNAAPDYMVFDLAATSNQRVSYYPAEEFLPGGLLTNPDYRTTRLLMRKIPANGAVFTMGSVAEAGRLTNESVHSATLNNDYYLGVFEVTQTQWALVMGSNPSWFTTEGAMRPVECVSWQMARTKQGSEEYNAAVPENPIEGSFMSELRKLSGGKIDFDLPYEAEWEYACRAGNGEGYWGNGLPIRQSNVPGRIKTNQKDTTLAIISSGNEEIPSSEKSEEIAPDSATSIVGTYGKNNFGLYDMHGNVWEWCLDMYLEDISGYNGAPVMSGGVNSGRRNVLRGGSWNEVFGYARSAYRKYTPFNKNCAHYGIRVKCTTGAK